MIGNLDEAIITLLKDALPGLLGGAAPPVALSVQSDRFAADPHAADALASEPRPDDQVDRFDFDPAGIVFDPSSPGFDPLALPRFTLRKPPYSGPRRVRLLTDAGDRTPLGESEVVWDETDTQRLTLVLAPNRDLIGVNGVEVLYGVIGVFTTVKLNAVVSVVLECADAEQLARCTGLAAGVIELHRPELLGKPAAAYDDGLYGAAVKVNSLQLLEGDSPAANQRRLRYRAEVELKSTRSLRDDEGRPILRVRTPHRPLDPTRPVDIEIGVEA